MRTSGKRLFSSLECDCVFITLLMAAGVMYIVFSVPASASDGTKRFLGYHSLNDERTEEGESKIYVSRQKSVAFKDNVTLVDLPGQPDQMVIILLSIVASNTGVSQSVSNGIIKCLSEVSETERERWGAFRLHRFAPALAQVEYFVISSEEVSLGVAGKVDPFIRDGKLIGCVRGLNVDLPEEANLLEGRTVIAPDTASIISSKGQAPGWAIGIVIGVVGLFTLIVLIYIWCQGEKVYKEEDYEKYEDESVDDEDESEDEQLESVRFDTRQGMAVSVAEQV